MCTGMLLNFHTVTRRPWRFAVRSSTEPHNSDRNVVPARGPGAPRRVRLAVTGGPHASPSYAGPRGGRRRVVLRPPLYSSLDNCACCLL